MIQVKRGKTSNWMKQETPLADGQPGYDRERNKLKIGDGKRSWNELPDASGVSADTVLMPESKAKEVEAAKQAAIKTLGPVGSLVLAALNKEDKPIFTYGTESPDENTVGKVYLQYYDSEPEVDYVVDWGINGIWTYQKWHSGIAKCWGTLKVKTAVDKPFESIALFSNRADISSVSYPLTFDKIPTETASLQTPGGLVWLASKLSNTTKTTATYNIISVDSLTNTANYSINLHVEGFWK